MTRVEYEAKAGRLLEHLDVRHFTAAELCRVGRRAGDVQLKAPAEELLVNLIPTIVRLEQVRRELGCPLSVTSGYRDPAYNRAVGGAPASYHTLYNAVDVSPRGRPTLDLYSALRALPGAEEKFGIGRYATRGFVHFDTRGLIRPGAPPWNRTA